MKKTIFVAASILVGLFSEHAVAQQTTVAFDSGSVQLYTDVAKTILVTGGSSAPGDGAVLQLGYFTASAVGSEFAGAFVPLSGEGSSTAFTTTTMGDDPFQGAGDGTFALSLNFNALTTIGVTLPPAGTILAIRFYNGTSISSSSAYNTVTSDATNWQFKTPTVPSSNVGFSLDDGGLLFQGGTASAFVTTIAVPEPSVIAVFAVGLGVACVASVRKRQIA